MADTRSLEPRYFERMAASLGDKARLLPHVVGPRVADVGAGGGELAQALAEAGYFVTAVDNSADSLRHLDKLLEPGPDEEAPALAGVVHCYADELPDVLPDGERFDTLIASSLLHEVYSYGSSTGQTGWDAVRQTLRAFAQVIRPGGRLLIRDGVAPSQPGEAATVEVPDDALVQRYLSLTPHLRGELTHDRPGVWSGTRRAVAEMMLTLTWGEQSLARESQEFYTFAGAEQMVSEAAACGFQPLGHSTVTQSGYVQALREYRARDTDGNLWFPNTNGVWVFERLDRA